MFDDGDDDDMVDFDALAAIEEQALAARGGGFGAAAAVATTKTEKESDAAKGTTAADGGLGPSLFAIAPSSSSAQPVVVVDLTSSDSPRENRAPRDASAAKSAMGKQNAGETVAMNVEEDAEAALAATTAAAAAAAAPAAPPPPAPPPQHVRHLTLADVSKPPDLAALPWIHAEIKLDRSAARHWLAPVKPPPRPYQASIAATALLHNTLVCLPTGLGKTMVASVVMVNFARWFPAPSKIVFVAPTRPLVSQQVRACASVMGVLQTGEAVELTGSSATPRERAAVWDDPKCRFVFTTPQAFRNDLSLGVAPAHRIVCVVVDECHRCVGKSDGAVALRTLSEKLGVAARVVGLSATPGSTRSAVQEVLSATNAARIEFRAESDACLRDYVHRRSFEKLVVPPPPPPGPARAAACRALRRSLAAARSSGAAAVAAGSGGGGGGGGGRSSSSSSGPALSSGTLSLLSTQNLPCDPETAPRATLAAAAKRAERAAKEARAAAAAAGRGGETDDPPPAVVARALDASRHLRAAALLAGARDAVDAYGVRGGADYLAARAEDAAAAGLVSSSCSGQGGAAGAAAASNGEDNPEYRALFSATVGSGGDPKLSALLGVLEKHFGSELERRKKEEEASGGGDDENAAATTREGDEDRTRAIVFASLRETVAVIVRNLVAAGYDARPFVGQGTTTAAGLGVKGGSGGGGGGGSNNGDASGSGGMRQAEQAATLLAFRAGEFPVLVATCVGEEGLDVPAVDLCVCYDSAASPLRGVQRAGRAGRARPGSVVCLLSAGREEAAAAAAAVATAELHAALRAQAFDLARRAPRMLPREFVPSRLDVDLRAGDEEEEEEGEEGGGGEGGEEGNEKALSSLAARAASRKNVLPSSKRAAAAAARKVAWGEKATGGGRRAAAAAASAPPLPPPSPSQRQRPRHAAAAAATEVDGLLFPADTAPVVRFSPQHDQQQLVVDPPPAALVAAVEAEAEEAEAAAEAEEAAATTPATAAAPSKSDSEKVAAAAARLTQVLSVSQRAATGSKGGKRGEEDGDGDNDDDEEEEEEENLDGGNGGGEDTDSDFGAAGAGGAGNGWLNAGGWGDNDEGGWDLQQSLSSAGGASAASEEEGRQQQQQQQPATADRRGGASLAVAAAAVGARPQQRVLLDSASPALARMPRRRILEGALDSPLLSAGDGSPAEGAAAARPRRLLKKRRTSKAGAQAAAAAAAVAAARPQQQRRAPNAAAAAAFFDTEAGLSTDDDDRAAAGEEDEEGEEGSYESSFLDDGTQPEEEEDEDEEVGGGGQQRPRRRPRRLSDELAAYRARMVQDDAYGDVETPGGGGEGQGGPGGPGRRGNRRRRMRRLSDLVDDGGGDNQGEEEEEEQQREVDANDASGDEYDEDDSFIASARSDGRAPSVTGPSQHNAQCGVCGDPGGVAGKGALMGCAGCPTAVHSRCVSKTSKSGHRGGRDWLCAVCLDD